MSDVNYIENATVPIVKLKAKLDTNGDLRFPSIAAELLKIDITTEQH